MEDLSEKNEPFPMMRRNGDALTVAVLSAMGRIEAKVDENQRGAEKFRTEITNQFSKHVTDETIRQNDIEHKVIKLESIVKNYNTELLNAIHSVNITEALPRTKDGKPDIQGHRDEHEERRNFIIGMKNWFISIAKDGMKWLIGAAALASLYGIWMTILKGPS